MKGATDGPSNYDTSNFLEVNDVLHLLQLGFRCKHSSQHMLLNMTEKIRKTIDNGNFGCGIFIDLI